MPHTGCATIRWFCKFKTQDATQAVFIVLARKAGNLRREGNLGGWLHKVARNVALQALERRATSAMREKEVTMWHETVSDEAGLDSQADAALQFLDQELAGLSDVLRRGRIRQMRAAFHTHLMGLTIVTT
jgi:DNA-directed RNA polymerase specialized sigma24 family protein